VGVTQAQPFGLPSYRIGKATRRVASASVSIVEDLGGVYYLFVKVFRKILFPK